jgi:dienelactone hydrolase
MRFTRVIPVVALVLVPSFVSAQNRPTDQWLSRPVDDQTFRAYLDFFSYDHRLPFDVHAIDSTEEEGVAREHLSFVSTAGIRVTGNLYSPPGGASAIRGSIIFLHGGGAQGKDAAGYRQLCLLMARGGFRVLAIDMPHFGERTTGLLTTYTETEKHEQLYNREATYLEFVEQTVKDVSRSFDFLVQERHADSSAIAIVGHSRGAVLALIAGAVDRRLAAIAALHGGHFDFYETGHRAAACPANYIGRIAPRPLLMINGELDDDFLPATAIRPLQRLAREPREIRWTSGGHGFLPEAERTALVDWLRRAMPGH